MQNENKLCFIICVNNEEYYQEAILYLLQLHIPNGIEVEFLPVRGATSITQGYNKAMVQTDAKYKIYMHQDLLLINRDIIKNILSVFAANPTVGMIGLAGARKLPVSAVWWKAKEKYGSVYHVYTWESVRKTVYGTFDNDILSVQAIDGLFMATQYDVFWREDLFSGWHFYDISQSMEFLRHGYEVVIPNQNEPWCIHMCGDKELDQGYKVYQEKFLQEYRQDMDKYKL